MDPWRRILIGRTLGLGVALAVIGAAPSLAQRIIGGNVIQLGAGAARTQTDSELAENVFLPAEREVLRRLARARELLQQERYAEAARSLGAILDGPEDYFYQPDKKAEPGVHRSLKAEAHRLIGRMPPKGREAYELQYGARARQILGEAVARGDVTRLAEVSRRFFHTRAGYEAAVLLGLNHLDHGRPLAGALTLQRVREAPQQADRFEPVLSLALATCWLQAGVPEDARETLLGLKKQRADRAVTIAGQQVQLFGEQTRPTEWLVGLIGPQGAIGPAEPDRWAMFRGSPSRNASTAGSAPLLNMRWRIPATDDRLVEEILGQLGQSYLEHGVAALPASHPLVVHKEFVINYPGKPPWHVEDVVLMRTAKTLLAVDFRTGKRIWEAVVEDPSLGTTPRPEINLATRQWLQLAPALAARIWDDATYGTLSSDGECVFSIEDLPMGINVSSSPRRIIVGGVVRQAPAPKVCNRLAAHEIPTGKRVWDLGGSPESDGPWDPLPMAGTFFLGPPLPLMGRLYVLAEVNGEIRLLALQPNPSASEPSSKVKLLWSQQLALVERNALQDPVRRLAGASPSYADGILVCPTSNGAVVAVDLATRSLLWGYRYDRPAGYNRYAAVIFHPAARPGSQPAQGWCDATATVVEGRVLITPVESEYLHCLNLIDGELLWKYKREDDLYVACVHQDKVVLVGRGQVRALSLAETAKKTETVRTTERTLTGIRTSTSEVTMTVPKVLWMAPLPEGSMVSGRGFLSRARYFVPLSTAEVVAVDLAAGKLGRVSKSRKGKVPGNLVCYRGRVISQGSEGLETFYQSDAAREEVDRRLAADPDDPAALSLRGELLWDEGKQAEALTCLRRANELSDDPRTRILLRDALLDALHREFAAHRDRAEEVERLLDDPAQRATYLRLMAAGLRGAGEWRAAVEYYMKLVDLDQAHSGMEQVTKALSVRRDRWIQAQLAALREEADQEALAAIDQPVEARLQAALKTGEVEPLRRFLDYFGSHPAAGKARRELVRRLKDSGQLLQTEMVLWREQRAADREVAGAATAELAEVLRGSKRPEDAAWCYRRLAEQFADVVCREGKTGKELFGALPEAGPIRSMLDRKAEWPTGLVEDKPGGSKPSSSSYVGRYGLPYRGSRRPFFTETTLRFDQSRRTLRSYDGLGRERWQVSLAPAGQSLPYNPSWTHGRVSGHLLLLSMGYKVLAVDTLGSADAGEAKLLWSRDLIDTTLDAATVRRLAFQVPNIQWPIHPLQLAQLYAGNRVCALGPVTSRYVCYQHSRHLVAADPLSGETLWVRRDVAPQSVLFGDDELLLAATPEKTEATVFRALDGELLGKRKVPLMKSGPDQPVVVSPFGLAQLGLSPFGQAGVATIGRQILHWREESGKRMLELFDPWRQCPVWAPLEFDAAAKACLVEDEAVAVFEPDGHFVLVAVSDGRLIVDATLEAEKTLAEILVLRTGGQYILVTHSPPPQPPANAMPIQPMPGALFKLINYGRVYSFDLEGNPMWPEPAEIENQHLLLDQHSRMPVLIFACQQYQRNARRSTERYKQAILCLDKRTGRAVYERDTLSSSTRLFEVVADPQQHTVELRTIPSPVVLTFTDKPIPPESERKKGAGRPSAGVGSGVLKAMKKAISETLQKAENRAEGDDDPFAPPAPDPPPKE